MDDLLPALGEFGRYQKLLLWLICLPACIPCGFCAFNQLFMTDAPDDYWCSVPELSEFNLTEEKIRELSIPATEVVIALNLRCSFVQEEKKNFKILLRTLGKWCFGVQQVLPIRSRLAKCV